MLKACRNVLRDLERAWQEKCVLRSQVQGRRSMQKPLGFVAKAEVHHLDQRGGAFQAHGRAPGSIRRFGASDFPVDFFTMIASPFGAGEILEG